MCVCLTPFLSLSPPTELQYFRVLLVDVCLVIKFIHPTGILSTVYKLQSGIIGVFTLNKEESSGKMRKEEEGAGGYREKEGAE